MIKHTSEGLIISKDGQEVSLDLDGINALRDQISVYGPATSEHPFKVGDKVKMREVEGEEDYFMGRVEVVTMVRSLRWQEEYAVHQLSTMSERDAFGCPEPFDDADMYVSTHAQEALNFADKLAAEQKPLDEDIAKLVQENFHKLVSE